MEINSECWGIAQMRGGGENSTWTGFGNINNMLFFGEGRKELSWCRE